MKQMRWKLLIRSLFSELRLRKREVKLRLVRARLEVVGEDVRLGHVQEPVDQARAHLQGVDVALEELVALEDLHDLLAVLLHEGLVVAGQHVEHLGALFDDDILESHPGLEGPEDALEQSRLVRSPGRN